MKKCSKCNISKNLDLFYKDKAFRDGRRSQCKECDGARRVGSLSVKRYDLKRQYGISLEQYNELASKQEHKCAICSIARSTLNYDLCVDHNHNTGEVRKLLCKPCNLLVGNSLENIEILNKTIEYLRLYEKS